MTYLSVFCVLIAASLLSYLGSTYFKRPNQRDKTFGFALWLSSLFAIFYGGASVLEFGEGRDGANAVTRNLLCVAAVIAWLASAVYAFQHSSSPATVYRLSVGLVVLFVIWMIYSDSRLTWVDLAPLVGLAIWLGAEGARRSVKKRGQPSVERDDSRKGTWKRSA